MLKKFSDIKIKHQILMLTIIAICLVVVVQSIYYFRVTAVAKEKLQEFMENSVYQAEETVKIIFQNVYNAAKYMAYSKSYQTFLTSEDVFLKFTLNDNLKDIMLSTVETNNEIENIILLDKNRKCKYYYQTFDDSFLETLKQTCFSDGKMEGNEGFYYVKKLDKDNEDIIIYAMPIVYHITDAKYGQNIGTIIVIIKSNSIRKIVDAIQIENVELFIVDNKKEVIISNHNKRLSLSDEDNIDINSNITIRRNLGFSDWEIIGSVNGRAINKDYEFFKSFAIVVGIIMLILLIVLLLIFYKSIAIPITAVSGAIDRIGENSKRLDIDIPLQNEIGNIVNSINNMLIKLDSLTRKIVSTQMQMYETELVKKQTELYALQSQVNPHFLFNTLQCMGGIALARGMNEINDICAAMAGYLQVFNKSRRFR